MSLEAFYSHQVPACLRTVHYCLLFSEAIQHNEPESQCLEPGGAQELHRNVKIREDSSEDAIKEW